MEFEIIRKPEKAYKGEAVYKHNEKDGLCCIEYKIDFPENLKGQFTTEDEIECYKERLEKIVKAFCDKKLKSYKNPKLKNMKLKSFKYKYDYDNTILILKGYNGIDSFNMGLTAFLSDIDVFLYYYFMSLGKVGQHYKIIQEVIREQHQWHWLDEEPDYDNLLVL